MHLTYQVERWADVWEEMSVYFDQHYIEASDHINYGIKPCMNIQGYDDLEAKGLLHLVTVRDGARLVGYATYICQGHLHYANTLHAFGTDLYYLDPAYRQGLAGYRLFQVIERTLIDRGVQYIIHRSKTWKDLSRIFERLGYREIERAYAKGIGKD